MSKNEHGAIPFQALRAAVQNKRGSVYVKWVCIILFLIILVAFMISFITAVDTVEGHRAFAKHSLDSYTEEHSIKIYEAVKQNDSSSRRYSALETNLRETLITDLGLTRTDLYEFSKFNESGEKMYSIKIAPYAAVRIQKNEATKLVTVKLKYTLSVPVTFMGVNTVWVEIPMEIISEFTPKF